LERKIKWGIGGKKWDISGKNNGSKMATQDLQLEKKNA